MKISTYAVWDVEWKILGTYDVKLHDLLAYVSLKKGNTIVNLKMSRLFSIATEISFQIYRFFTAIEYFFSSNWKLLIEVRGHNKNFGICKTTKNI